MKLATFGIGAGLAVAASATFAVFWMLPAAVMPARWVATDCRQVEIEGPDGPILGAEDIALSADRKLLYISAYDRLAVEEAIKLNVPRPEGGLYVVSVSDLDRIDGASATLAIDRLSIVGGLRPHGIDVAGRRMAMINRGFSRTGAAQTEVMILEPDGEDGADGRRFRIADTIRSSGFCAANDVVLTSLETYLTLDRGTCPGWSWDERLGLDFHGQLLRLPLVEGDPARAVLTKLAFPNGIAVIQAGPFRGAVIAETRRERLLFAEAEDWVEIPLPGGPDNLSVDAEGMIVAAVHPSLAKLALYRYGWIDNAPSRIVRVNPVSGEVEVLFDDPAGEIFSAASSAVIAGRTMIAGSVLDRGVLICRFGLG